MYNEDFNDGNFLFKSPFSKVRPIERQKKSDLAISPHDMYLLYTGESSLGLHW
jgi:hypothetical protein